MKSLIIGAGGFVGTHLLEYLLKQNEDVYCTYLQQEYDSLYGNANAILVNVLQLEDIKHCLSHVNPDKIYYLAAQASVKLSWELPRQTTEINTIGVINLLEVIRSLQIPTKVLIIGSSEEYGISPSSLEPIDESFPLNPSNPYAISKLAQEYFCNLYYKAYNLDIIMVRAFNHMGPGQRDDFVVSSFAKKIAMIEKGTIDPVLHVGNLNAKRDFTDVRDIVRAYYLLMDKGHSGDVYNVGSSNALCIADILDAVGRLSTAAFDVVIDKSKFRPIDVPIIRCNNNKLTAVTGWKPEIPLEQTLNDTLDYWRARV